MTIDEKRVVQRDTARENANAKRTGVARMREHVQAGRVSLETLLLDPPELLHHLAIVDVMALARTNPRNGTWRANIGRAAVRDGVNLLMPVGQASLASREWAARWSPRVNRAVVERRREVERAARAAAAAWDEAAA